MANPTRTQKPAPDPKAPPPETHQQTRTVEQKISPQHNTTEPYGKSSDHAAQTTED
jgi:hypothetical protein